MSLAGGQDGLQPTRNLEVRLTMLQPEGWGADYNITTSPPAFENLTASLYIPFFRMINRNALNDTQACHSNIKNFFLSYIQLQMQNAFCIQLTIARPLNMSQLCNVVFLSVLVTLFSTLFIFSKILHQMHNKIPAFRPSAFPIKNGRPYQLFKYLRDHSITTWTR